MSTVSIGFCVILYVLIAVFLNPWMRSLIRKDRSSLKWKEKEGSVFFSIIWPFVVVFVFLCLVVLFVCTVIDFVYNLGRKIFKI